MVQPAYRHEHKHAINLADYHALRQRLRLIASLDPHAGPNGRYHIRSLYFDNDDDLALRDKLSGLARREKFRLRIYHKCGDFVRLEKKSKCNGLCVKQSLALTGQQAEMILAGDIDWLRDAGQGLPAEFYAKLRQQRLRPKTLVDYWREAYLYAPGNVRITFDFDVRTGLYATNLFDFRAPTAGTGAPGQLLLEVKYDAFLPDLIRDLIQTNARQGHSFSKYAACRIYG